jgi:tetratricopeptide (TPR) repeat protein
MTSAEALQLLVEAKGDDEKITLATVEIAASSQANELQNLVREAIYAAAVPHWFDEKILTALLNGTTPETASQLYRILEDLSFVEGFPRYQACSVHERARSHLLAFLNRESPEKYQLYSSRCFEYFRSGTTPHMLIEAAYHLLIAAPDVGAGAIGGLYDQWSQSGAWETLQAMAAALDELLRFRRLEGLASAAALDVVASIRAPYQSLAETQSLLDQALEIYRRLGDTRQESVVLNELGDIQRAQGDLDGAQRSFEASMEIRKKLAERDPENTEWQRDLSISHNKLGDIQQLRGDLDGAQHSYEAGMEIVKKLAEGDPENTQWQRDLSVCYSKMSRVCRLLEKGSEARQWAEADLAIAQELAERDPSNAQWRQDVEFSRKILADLEAESRGDG